MIENDAQFKCQKAPCRTTRLWARRDNVETTENSETTGKYAVVPTNLEKENGGSRLSRYTGIEK